MMNYTYKDHDFKVSVLSTLAFYCWDYRSKKPTNVGVAFFVILAFIMIHWIYSSPRNDSLNANNPKFNKDVMGPVLPQKEMSIEELQVKLHLDDDTVAEIRRADRGKDPQHDEFNQVLAANRAGSELRIPQFDPNAHIDPKPENSVQVIDEGNRPKPKEYPVELLQQPDIGCTNGPGLLLLLVENSPDNTGSRLAIRDTWGVQSHEKFPRISADRWKTIFIMGSGGNHFNAVVQKENREHGDILQGNFTDIPHESTRKFMMALEWIGRRLQDCPPKFVLKTKDNIFHNMYSITEWLQRRWTPSDSPLYVGKRIRNDIPIRDPYNPLYVDTNDFSPQYFPDLIEKPVYLFDWSAFTRILQQLRGVTPIAMEDGFVALLAERAGLTAKHNDHFQQISRTNNVCAHLKMFFVHNIRPYEHLQIWKDHKDARRGHKCPGAKIVYRNANGKPVSFDV